MAKSIILLKFWSVTAFIDLVSLNISEVNSDIRQLFDLVYNNIVPMTIQCYFRDSYLFCLYKDPEDLTKLRPIGIPSAMRRIITSHVAISTRQRFARRILPYNYAVGVDGGMDFIIKSMQLSTGKNIQIPQQESSPLTRAIVFADISNMFNSVSRESLMNIIALDFPELLPLAYLLYGGPGTVHHRWEDGSWRSIQMLEGVNQGCPLLAIFAALVLDRVLRPLDALLRQRAND